MCSVRLLGKSKYRLDINALSSTDFLESLSGKGRRKESLLLDFLGTVCGHQEQINLFCQGSFEDNPDFPSCLFLETVPKKVTDGGNTHFHRPWRGLN